MSRKSKFRGRELSDLDWFDPIVGEEELHYKFVHLLDPSYSCEKSLLEKWIKDFIVKDGVLKTVKEFQTTFHSQFWEVYLNRVIYESGGVIDENISSPDFYVKKGEFEYALEAVVANISDSGAPEKDRQMEDVYGRNDIYKILDESIIRVYNSIKTKSNKYLDKYYKVDQIKNIPYVIAVGDFSQINYGQSGYYSPLAVLFNAYYDADEKLSLKILGSDSLGKEYKFLESVKNVNGIDLPLGIFSNADHKHISAIVYSCTLTLGKLSSLSKDHFPYDKFIVVEREHLKTIRYSGSNPDEFLCDGIFVFHNPFSENPFPKECLDGVGTTHVYRDEDQNFFNIDCNIGSALMRRMVGIRGEEYIYVKDIEEYHFFQLERKEEN